jgi:SnoaL-like protein
VTTPDATDAATRFLEALATRDFRALGGCFAADGRLRALVPTRLRDEEGREAIAARYDYWYGALDEFELTTAEAAAVADRVAVRYRVRGIHREDGPVVQEQQGYATVVDGLIATLNVVCSGFRPAA